MLTKCICVFSALGLALSACASPIGTLGSQNELASNKLTASQASLTRSAVIEARRKYSVTVVSFDSTQEFGTKFPYSDYVRLRIKNDSEVALPSLTVLTKRLDASGRMIGSSRAPSLSLGDLRPGETAEVDYYPRGHLPGVARITVEIEDLIPPDSEQFFEELKGVSR